jgi:cell division protease FtsH
MQYGMSDKLGALKFGRHEGDVFLGRDLGHERDFSEEVAAQIDDEVRRLIEQAHDEAWDILVEYRDVLDNLVLRLLDKETVNKEELAEIFAPVQKRPARVFESSRRRPAKDIPPVLTPAELALLGPQDGAALTTGNGRGRGGNGSRSNGSRTSASRTNGSGATGRTAKSTSGAKRTPARRTAKRAADSD